MGLPFFPGALTLPAGPLNFGALSKTGGQVADLKHVRLSRRP